MSSEASVPRGFPKRLLLFSLPVFGRASLALRLGTNQRPASNVHPCLLQALQSAKLAPNDSFKPNPLRSGKGMAEEPCHAFASTVRVGLTQVLGHGMELTATQTEPEALTALAREAAGLLTAGRYDPLVQAFGYALAFGRDLAEAVQADLTECLAELGATGLSDRPASVKVSRFSANSTGLVALAECTLPANPRGQILLELVVTAAGAQHHVTLEQITAVA